MSSPTRPRVATSTDPVAPAKGRRTDGGAERRSDRLLKVVRTIIDQDRRDDRLTLSEPAGLALLEALAIAVPRRVVVGPAGSPTAAELARLEGSRVVVKVIAAGLAHKSDVGGVELVDRTSAAVIAATTRMSARLDGRPIDGFLVEELVEHDPGPGGELLLSLRWTDDFGPIISAGIGGVQAEVLARDLRPGRDVAIVAPGLTSGSELSATLAAATGVRLATESHRGRPAPARLAALVATVERLARLAPLTGPGGILDLEINPLAATPAGLVALDVLVNLDPRPPTDGRASARPLVKLDRLLAPRSIAIAGVSSGANPGRTILRNILREGFDPGRISVVKPGVAEIDGCRCVPDLASLPGKVDLLVVAVAAGPAAELVAEAAERDAAESIIVIPGGFEETSGGGGRATMIRAALAAARRRPGGGPLVNGGNCLGIRSRPGRYDTFFIPEAKLAAPSGRPAPLAIVAQSGAFALSRLSRLGGLDPTFVVTVGNQVDLTIGDHLAHLAADPEVRVVGVYVEGFASLDGRAFLAAARAIADRGGVVVLYRAGRTAAGVSASASHTAAIAGDAVVTDRLARGAGVVVAETLTAFDDLVRSFTLLDGRVPGGRGLGAVSNAGFECVAIGDAAGSLSPARFSPATTDRLADLLGRAGIGSVVDVHDPLDLTPMADDATFAEAAAAVLADPGVDVGLVGNVPFTAALATLPSEASAGEDLTAPGSIGPRLVELWRTTTKPWVAIVDAGSRFDPLAALLERGGIPTFRTADAALGCLAAVVEQRLRRRPSIDGGPGPA